jgi:pyridoxine kinase
MEPWLRDLTPPHIRSPVSDQEQSLLCLASVRALAADAGVVDAMPSRGRGRRRSTVYAGCIPLIPGYFSGVGDLFSALVLGHYHHRTVAPQRSRPPLAPLEEEQQQQQQQPEDRGASSSPSSLPPLPHAVSLALTKTHAILRLTAKHASSLPPDERTTTDDELDKKDPERRVRRMRGRELRLVQGRKILSGEAMGELRSLGEWEDFWGPD